MSTFLMKASLTLSISGEHFLNLTKYLIKKTPHKLELTPILTKDRSTVTLLLPDRKQETSQEV